MKDALVVFGFPDIIFQTKDVFVQLLELQIDTNADVVLGICPVNKPQKCDIVDICDDGRIEQILIKPTKTNLRYAWVIAVWTQVFTNFMYRYLSTLQDAKEQHNTRNNIMERRELFVGDVVQAAINNNLKVEGVISPDSSCLDIGTPEDLLKAIREQIKYG